jgi:hypothetical protein
MVSYTLCQLSKLGGSVCHHVARISPNISVAFVFQFIRQCYKPGRPLQRRSPDIVSVSR